MGVCCTAGNSLTLFIYHWSITPFKNLFDYSERDEVYSRMESYSNKSKMNNALCFPKVHCKMFAV